MPFGLQGNVALLINRKLPGIHYCCLNQKIVDEDAENSVLTQGAAV